MKSLPRLANDGGSTQDRPNKAAIRSRIRRASKIHTMDGSARPHNGLVPHSHCSNRICNRLREPHGQTKVVGRSVGGL